MTIRTHAKTISQFGAEACRKAYQLHRGGGEGATVIADYLSVSVTAAHRMVAAGESLQDTQSDKRCLPFIGLDSLRFSPVGFGSMTTVVTKRGSVIYHTSDSWRHLTTPIGLERGDASAVAFV